MTAKKLYLAGGIFVTVLLIPSLAGTAHAAYIGNVGADGTTGVGTLEEYLALAESKVLVAEKYPGAGSGTPYFDLDGVLGASLVAGSIFGGITFAFVVKARHGRYLSPGMG